MPESKKVQINYESRIGIMAQQQALAAMEQRLLRLEERVEERFQRTAEECQASLSKTEASLERRVQVRLRDTDREQRQFDRRLTELAGHCQEITESLHGHVRRCLETFNKHSQKLSDLKVSSETSLPHSQIAEDLSPRPEEPKSDAGLRMEIDQVSEKLQRYYEDSMGVHTRLQSLEYILRYLRSQVDVHMELQREALVSTEQRSDSSAVLEERFSKLIDQFSTLHVWAEAFGTRLASLESAMQERSAIERQHGAVGRKEFNEAGSRGSPWMSTLSAGHLLAVGVAQQEEKKEAHPPIVTCLSSYARNAEAQREEKKEAHPPIVTRLSSIVRNAAAAEAQRTAEAEKPRAPELAAQAPTGEPLARNEEKKAAHRLNVSCLSSYATKAAAAEAQRTAEAEKPSAPEPAPTPSGEPLVLSGPGVGSAA